MRLNSSFAVKSLVPEKILSIITDIIAPTDAIATSPKLSISEALLSFFIVDTPSAKASIKGTAKIPVVAPEASKAIVKNSIGVNSANIKTKI